MRLDERSRSRSDLPEFHDDGDPKFLIMLIINTFIEKSTSMKRDISEETLDDILERMQT
jgi:hypothetical protein